VTYKVFGEVVTYRLGYGGCGATPAIIPHDLKIGSDDWWAAAISPHVIIPIPAMRALFIRAYPLFAESCTTHYRNLTHHTMRSILRLWHHGRISRRDENIAGHVVDQFCRDAVLLYEINAAYLASLARDSGSNNFYAYSRCPFWRQHAVSLVTDNYFIGAALARAGDKLGMPTVIQDMLHVVRAF
jgi:hypothetical protein